MDEDRNSSLLVSGVSVHGDEVGALLHGGAARSRKRQSGGPVRRRCLATLLLLLSEQPHLALSETTTSRSYFSHNAILSGYKIK